MKKVQHGKSAACKKCYMKKVQHGKRRAVARTPRISVMESFEAIFNG